MSRLGSAVAAALVVAVAIVSTTGVVGAAPAAAHAGLVNSDPRDGAELGAPPAQVRLTFSEELIPDAVAIVATRGDGSTVELPAPAVDGPAAIVAWPEAAGPGDFTVAYRVVSQDGHPISGALAFTVAGDPSPTTTSATPTPTSASPTPAPTTASPTPTPEPSPTQGASSGGSPMPLIVSGLLIGAAIGVVVTLLRRRRS